VGPFIFCTMSHGAFPAGPARCHIARVESDVAVIRRWVEAWNAHDVDAAVELLAPDFARHDANLPEVAGTSAQRAFLTGLFRAFPDMHIDIAQSIAQADTVAIRIVVRATHRDEFLGIPATGKEIGIQSVDIFRLTDGKIAEQWVVMDALGLMQQLGAVPAA
jgi:steroid delta-isomerase-like uncharacterized protein